MRVALVTAIPKNPPASAASVLDTGTGLALQNFAAAIAGEDSLFLLLEPLLGPRPAGADRPREFSADVVLAFRDPGFARGKTLYFSLLEKLDELLQQAGSPETLAAKLCLLAETRDVPHSPQIALCIRLIALGDSPEQASLRWGLGLAHLQQALLFTSRLLRQQVQSAGG